MNVNMIFISINCLYVERGILLDDSVDFINQFIFDVVFDVFSSISCSPHNVVFMLICAVTQASDSHATSVSRGTVYTLTDPFIPRLALAERIAWGFLVFKKR